MLPRLECLEARCGAGTRFTAKHLAARSRPILSLFEIVKIVDVWGGISLGGLVMQVQWTMLHPTMTMERLGFIPLWLHDNSPDDAVTQLDKGYPFGGWQDFNGFSMRPNGALTYPGDPTLEPLAKAILRDETIFFYQFAWVAVRKADGSFRVARMD